MSDSMSSSHYHMWLSIIALIYADGQKHPEEARFIAEMIAKMPGTEEQKQQLTEAAENPPDINIAYKGITEPKHRSQLIYFARLLFWSDGDFHHQEQKILEALHSDVMSKADLEKAMRDVDDVAQKFHVKMEADESAKSWSQKLVDAIIFWENLF